MSLTKIKPTGINETLDFLFDSITANSLTVTNTFNLSGSNIASESAEVYANAAYDQANTARIGELDGVANQIDQDLVQPRRIGVNRFRYSTVVDDVQSQTFLDGPAAHQRSHPGHNSTR